MISARTTARLHDPEATSSTRLRGRRRRRASRGRAGGFPDASRAQEWALDRILKNNSSAITFLGITLGVFISRRFFALPVAVALMMAQDTLGTAGLVRARKAVQG